jgi:hypothetical protein
VSDKTATISYQKHRNITFIRIKGGGEVATTPQLEGERDSDNAAIRRGEVGSKPVYK